MRTVVFKLIHGIVLLTLVLMVAGGGCAWWRDHGTVVKQGLIDCSVVAVKQEAANFYPIVQSILKGAKPDWEDQLQKLIAVGKEAAICAVQAVVFAFQTAPTGALKAGPDTLQHQAAAARGAAFLAKHRWQVK